MCVCGWGVQAHECLGLRVPHTCAHKGINIFKFLNNYVHVNVHKLALVLYMQAGPHVLLYTQTLSASLKHQAKQSQFQVYDTCPHK